jgi:type IV pilus biogenesis protein CpaD/CtpE
MRFMVLATAAALLSACSARPPAQTSAIPELTARVAGAPQRCITFEQGESLRIAGPHSLVYGNGRVVYLNAVPQCSTLRRSHVLVLEPIGSRYCRGDFVRTRDNVSGLPGPGCRLGDFVPYTRP